MERKLRGNFPVKLNINSRPIEYKYGDGKVKRTLKRELKVPEIAKKEANETSSLSRDCKESAWISVSVTSGRWCCWWAVSECFLWFVVNVYCVLGEVCLVLWVTLLGFQSLGKGLCRDTGKRSVVENFGERVVLLSKWCSPSLKNSAADPGHWLNGSFLPVLKHGPRSLTYVRVRGWQTYTRNESNSLDFFVLHKRPTSIFGERFEYEHIC